MTTMSWCGGWYRQSILWWQWLDITTRSKDHVIVSLMVWKCWSLWLYHIAIFSMGVSPSHHSSNDMIPLIMVLLSIIRKPWSSINQWTILLGTSFCVHTTHVLVYLLNIIIAWHKTYYEHYRYTNKKNFIYLPLGTYPTTPSSNRVSPPEQQCSHLLSWHNVIYCEKQLHLVVNNMLFIHIPPCVGVNQPSL
jgi:hypothetical protein